MRMGVAQVSQAFIFRLSLSQIHQGWSDYRTYPLSHPNGATLCAAITKIAGAGRGLERHFHRGEHRAHKELIEFTILPFFVV